jgi:hypothetical protein
MGQLFTNNATAILQGNISAVDTQLTVTASLADLFAVATTSNWGSPLNWYKVTLEDNLGNVEIVKVGIRTLGSGILSNLLRGQDGTTARNWNAGANVAARFTAQDLIATVGATEANAAAIAAEAVDREALEVNLAGTGTGQGAAMSGINYANIYTAGSVGYEIKANSNDYINVMRYIPPSEWPAIFNKTSTYDCTTAVQAAVNFAAASARAGTVFYPAGLFNQSATIRENTSGGAVRILGSGKYATDIKISALAGPAFWFGNSTGHGVYRGELSHFTLRGAGKTVAGSIGLRMHECGYTQINHINLRDFETLEEWVGCIGIAHNHSELYSGKNGIIMSVPTAGTPSSLDDILITDSPLSIRTNCNRIYANVFGSIDDTSIRIAGGGGGVTFNVFQSCGANINADVISVTSANESFDYGGGPSITHNWFEGGTYRYAIAVRSTRMASVRYNELYGSSSNISTNLPKEGAILFDNSDDYDCAENSIRGFFVGAATEGRVKPAGIYIAANSSSYKSAGENANYIVKTQTNIYHDGVPAPDISKPRIPHWAVVTITAGVPVITNSSSDWLASVSKQAAGRFLVTMVYNRELPPSGMYPVHVTAFTDSTAVAYSASVMNAPANQNFQLVFINNSNIAADPPGFTISAWSESTTGV